MVDLNTTLVNGSGWHLDRATAINDYNQIAGAGTHNGQAHAFLLVAAPTVFVIPACTLPPIAEVSAIAR